MSKFTSSICVFSVQQYRSDWKVSDWYRFHGYWYQYWIFEQWIMISLWILDLLVTVLIFEKYWYQYWYESYPVIDIGMRSKITMVPMPIPGILWGNIAGIINGLDVWGLLVSVWIIILVLVSLYETSFGIGVGIDIVMAVSVKHYDQELRWSWSVMNIHEHEITIESETWYRHVLEFI